MKKTACKNLPVGDLIRRFSVSFRLRSAHGRAVEEREIGCEVELIGQHYAVGRHVGGGCPHCLEVLLVLLELYDRILSRQQPPYPAEEIAAPCEKLIHYASTTRDWPEVVLDVKIIRHPALQPVSENWVTKLADEIRTELLDIGCREIPPVYAQAVANMRPLIAARAV